MAKNSSGLRKVNGSGYHWDGPFYCMDEAVDEAPRCAEQCSECREDEKAMLEGMGSDPGEVGE